MLTIARYRSTLKANALLSKLEESGISAFASHLKTDGKDVIQIKIQNEDASNAILVYEQFEHQFIKEENEKWS